MSPVRLNVPAKRVRLVCLVVFFAVVLSTLPVHRGATAQGSRPRRTQGPPSRNLPNLDETRGIEPGTPKIMPSVPATKCRGRDEKCKMAKGKISDNLSDNQDQLLAHGGHRFMQDYADWMNGGIPALSMLANLIYWPARMISDFPGASYRDGGGALTESAAKGADPRDETSSNVASGRTRKEYGLSEPSTIVAQGTSVLTVNPRAYQTPDSSQGSGFAVDSAINKGHGSTQSHASQAWARGGQTVTKTCLWHSFYDVSGTKTRLTLKFDWTLNASADAFADDSDTSASASYNFRIEYSLDNGSTWTVRGGQMALLVFPAELGRILITLA